MQAWAGCWLAGRAAIVSHCLFLLRLLLVRGIGTALVVIWQWLPWAMKFQGTCPLMVLCPIDAPGVSALPRAGEGRRGLKPVPPVSHSTSPLAG